MKKILIKSVILILILISALNIYNKFAYTNNTEEVFVNIESGSSLSSISEQLKENGIINSRKYFILYTKLKGLENKIQAGKFRVPANIEMNLLLDKLQNPEQEYIKLTIPEGYTVYQIASLLEDNNLVRKDKFVKIAKKGSDELQIENNSEGIIYSLEGYIYPDTYYIPKGFQEKEIVKMTLERLDELFTEEYKEQAESLEMSIQEVITIASLIEKEAANDHERKTISGVIYNRLKSNMPLQIDAAVIYGITKGESHINRLLYKDLEFDSLYNTYKYKGLPPGPIGSPGLASIEAALNPEAHDYLYYVLNKNGTKHIFSKTYKEHLNNKNSNN
ncbi:endolytic transglycosylase MltG [Sporosalibacterium faouarense]|uniref:endolytic transglycosylase MltG n=1 Tax=Sporosalibacterium faouarense TaxID=516123 RepID=UPI00192B49FD|nr:endolytic transglycosylase MltG [Sporosalibacterium faouarense]